MVPQYPRRILRNRETASARRWRENPMGELLRGCRGGRARRSPRWNGPEPACSTCTEREREEKKKLGSCGFAHFGFGVCPALPCVGSAAMVGLWLAQRSPAQLHPGPACPLAVPTLATMTYTEAKYYMPECRTLPSRPGLKVETERWVWARRSGRAFVHQNNMVTDRE